MSINSDPLVTPVTRPRPTWDDSATRRAMVESDADEFPVPRSRLKRFLVRGAVYLGAALLALRVLGGWLAEPLATPSVNPVWNIELTSSSKSSVLALAYSADAGIHILRVPGAGTSSTPQVLPARLARGELHLMSLGLSSLEARASGPPGLPLKSWRAKARTITAFQRLEEMGVRTSW